LFAHLQQYRPVSVESVLRSKEGGSVHPAVLALGLRYADGTIKGSTARCVAMVNALCQVRLDGVWPNVDHLSCLCDVGRRCCTLCVCCGVHNIKQLLKEPGMRCCKI
jgi:hypothetical protein